MRQVVIAGGGYAGTALARALDGEFDVTLVERGDVFYHNVGAMRAVADAAFYAKLLIPYDRLLRRGRVLRDAVTRVSLGEVVCASGLVLPADVVVVATGSGHVLPFKTGGRDAAAFLAEARAMSAEVAAAERVTILGDGPVGVELAGELSWRYPQKRLTLQGRSSQLLAGAGNARLGQRVMAMLRKRGVAFRLGTSEEPSGDALVIRAFGMDTAVSVLGRDSRVPVDGFFRVEGREGLYAIGDAADCGEPPLAYLARRQALYLAEYLRGRTNHPYRVKTRVGMAIPLGPELGALLLPIPGLPVAGSLLTSWLKGRNLFVNENWKRMGHPAPE